jgi:hypothetical protein
MAIIWRRVGSAIATKGSITIGNFWFTYGDIIGESKVTCQVFC